MKHLLTTFLLASCSLNSSKLSKEAMNLEVYAVRPNGCNVVGKVIGVSKQGLQELALNHALNQASEMEASGIFVEQVVPNGQIIKLFARAYKCD